MTTNLEAHVKHLVQNWVDAKKAEKIANELRLLAEAELLSALNGDLKPAGVTSFDVNGQYKLKITRKMTESWDQSVLAKLRDELEVWPFAIEWKLERDRFTVMERDYPSEFRRLRTALTVKEAKPSFVVEEK
jgi:hypothetical protein